MEASKYLIHFTTDKLRASNHFSCAQFCSICQALARLILFVVLAFYLSRFMSSSSLSFWPSLFIFIFLSSASSLTPIFCITFFVTQVSFFHLSTFALFLCGSCCCHASHSSLFLSPYSTWLSSRTNRFCSTVLIYFALELQ